MFHFHFEDEVLVEDINAMSFYEYVKHEMVLYIETDLSKKRFNAFKKKMEERSFYPIHLIRTTPNDTEESKRHKLKQLQQRNEENFKKRYRQVAKKQFGSESLFEIRDKIEKCPFCHKRNLIIEHDYSLEHTNCSLFFKCNSCDRILDRESFIFFMDGSYVYNATIERYLDDYCQNYGDKRIARKISDELKNTETICWMGFQYKMTT